MYAICKHIQHPTKLMHTHIFLLFFWYGANTLYLHDYDSDSDHSHIQILLCKHHVRFIFQLFPFFHFQRNTSNEYVRKPSGRFKAKGKYWLAFSFYFYQVMCNHEERLGTSILRKIQTRNIMPYECRLLNVNRFIFEVNKKNCINHMVHVSL